MNMMTAYSIWPAWMMGGYGRATWSRPMRKPRNLSRVSTPSGNAPGNSRGRCPKRRCLVRLLRYTGVRKRARAPRRGQEGPAAGFVLHLADATAELNALLFGDDLRLFFDGPQGAGGEAVPGRETGPDDMKRRLDLVRWMDRPMWMEVCLRSFILDKDRPLDTCHHRITHTVCRSLPDLQKIMETAYD
eukprot:jgi/Botrbrau1/9412/Bobra.0252s0037.1